VRAYSSPDRSRTVFSWSKYSAGAIRSSDVEADIRVENSIQLEQLEAVMWRRKRLNFCESGSALKKEAGSESKLESD